MGLELDHLRQVLLNFQQALIMRVHTLPIQQVLFMVAKLLSN